MKPLPLAVVVWKWGTLYDADHVNRFARMVRRNLSIPHRFVCLTDRFSEDTFRLDIDHVLPYHMPSKHAATHRANRRVEILSKDWPERLGVRRVLQLDLDLVILGNINSLCQGWNTPMASYWHPGASYNPSFFLLPDPRDTQPVKGPGYLGDKLYGSATAFLDACWQTFDADPEGTFKRALHAGWSRGCSDQAIINWWLCGQSNTKSADSCAEIDHRHGFYAYKRMSDLQRVHPPIQARIVAFTGKQAQAALLDRRHLWVEEALR